MTSTPSASSAFELLDDRIKRWIWQQGWHELRTGQERLIPLLIEGKYDVILAAPTSAGKTEAAFLPILTKLAANPLPSVTALYVSPLKALINDQFRRLDAFSDLLGIPFHRWHGDVTQAAKQRLLAKPSGALLITPESLEALFVNQGPQIRKLFAHLQYFVVDELHAFLGNERGAQLRSLMNRLDSAVGKTEVRVGLSATLADLHPAAQFLRGSDPANVKTISTEGHGAIRAQIKAFLNPEHDAHDCAPAQGQVIADLFHELQSEHHLVFTNTRARVEEYADALRQCSSSAGRPDIFLAHHGNLSKELREEAESRLRDDTRPVVCVCTSTLELGVDIGAMQSVAQITPPPSVTSLRQRVGRSGRRNDPATLRMYSLEDPPSAFQNPSEELRPALLRQIAALELMLEGWYELPRQGIPHFSTLVQQVMSMIVEHGGITLSNLYRSLCSPDSFSAIDQKSFLALLRAMKEHRLIQQMEDEGTLLLDTKGERIVSHFSFYAAFETQGEFRLVHGSRTLGTIPVDSALRANVNILFAGKRWRVLDVNEERKVILVEPSAGARPPSFAGSGGQVDKKVRERMREILERNDSPAFLSKTAQQLLDQARESYRRHGLGQRRSIANGRQTIIYPWSGDSEVLTLSLMLEHAGIESAPGEVDLVVDATPARSQEILRTIASTADHPVSELMSFVKKKRANKYDWVLPSSLLDREFAARELDVDGALHLARELIADSGEIVPPLSGPATATLRTKGNEPRLEVLDGFKSIGGTKILLSQRGEDILVDFGLEFKRYGKYFEEFLRPRSARGLLDLWHFHLVPRLDNAYREDLVPLGEQLAGGRPTNLSGILLSHAHVDHFGMIGTLRSEIPIHASPESLAIIKASQDTGRIDFWGEAVYINPRAPAVQDSRALRVEGAKVGRSAQVIGDMSPELSGFLSSMPSDDSSRRLIPGSLQQSSGKIGPFSYRAWGVDHSLLGCLAFEIETDLGRIVYTGDFRRHGALAQATERFVSEVAMSPPDILICEGTQVMRDSPNPTKERDVKNTAYEIARSSDGTLLIADFGPRHVERLRSFFEIAEAVQRRLVITTKDAYLLKALSFANPAIDLLQSNRVVIYDEVRASASRWEISIKEEFQHKLVDSREIRQNQGYYILAFSFFDCNELIDILPNNAVYIYSGSEAYNEDQVQDVRRLWAWCHEEFRMKVHGLSVQGDVPSFPDNLNASGHATGQDVAWLVEAIRPKRLVPVHRAEGSDQWFSALAQKLDIKVEGAIIE